MRRSLASFYLCCFLFLFFTVPSFSAVYVVNSTDNASDGVCDGTHCSLREAMVAANANPGADIIQFTVSGTIDLSADAALDFPTILQQLTIDGSTAPGAGITIINGLSYGFDVSGAASNTIIQNITINNIGNTGIGNGIGINVNGASDVSIINVNFDNVGFLNTPAGASYGNTINGFNADGLLIDGCTITGGKQNGIWVGGGSSNVVITGCTISSSCFHGIVLDDVSDFDINNCTSTNNGQCVPVVPQGWNSGAGIIIQNVANGTITNNTFSNSASESGIFINGTLGTNTGITISNNTICNNPFHGIFVNSGSNYTISNNTICDNTNIYGGGGSGVFIQNGSMVEVSSNSINNNECNGVYVGGGTGNEISQNTMMDNGCIGIDLNGGNAGVQPPTICSISSTSISGSTTGSGTIEIFIADPNDPCQGMTFVGSLVVTGGSWSLPGAYDTNNTYAISFTNAGSNTSEFTCDPGSITPPMLMDQSICDGQSITLDAGPGYSTYSWSNSQNTQSITVNPGTTTSYTVTVTDGSGCEATASAMVTVSSTLSASVNTFNHPLCSGENTGSATVTPAGGSGGYTYNWSGGGGSNATASNLSAGTYTVTVTDGNMCTTTAMVTLNDPNALTINLNETAPSPCGGMDGSITAIAGGGSPGYGYSWSPGGQTTTVISGLGAGTYTVTITDSNMCTTTASTTFTSTPGVNLAVLSANDPLCSGDSNGEATVMGSGGDGNFSYNWSSGGNTATVTNLQGGVNYIVTVTDGNGCTDVESVILTDPFPVTASINSSMDPSCDGNDGSATVTPGGGSGGYTYSWSPSGSSNSTATNLGPATHTVTVTDSNNCTETASVPLVAPNPVGINIISTNNPNCAGTSTGSIIVQGTAGNGSYSYSWSPSGGNSSTASNLSAGTYTVTVTDGNNCTATETITLTDPTALSVSIILTTDPSCTGNSNGTATAQGVGGSGGYFYNWSNGNTGPTATGLSANIVYQVTVTDSGGCTSTENVTLNDPLPMIATITNSTDPSCFNTQDGTAFVNVVGGDGNFTYNWSPSGGNTSLATGLSGGIAYTVTVTDGTGCTATTGITLTSPSAITASFIAVADPSCPGVNDGSATINPSGGAGGYSYNWSPTGGNGPTASNLSANIVYSVEVTDANNCSITETITLNDPAPLNINITGIDTYCEGSSTTLDAGGGFVNYSWSDNTNNQTTDANMPGFYSVTVTNAAGCTGEDDIIIFENPSPDPMISGSTSYCTGGFTTLDAGAGFQNYSWSTNENGQDIAVSTPGIVSVTVTDVNGCTGETSVNITENTSLTPIISGDLEFCENGFTTLDAGIGFSTYEWSTMEMTQSINVTTPGNYSVTISDVSGCTGETTVMVEQNTNPVVDITGDQEFCEGGDARLDAGTGFDMYLWSTTEIIDEIIVTQGGTYSVTVADENGCTASDDFMVTENLNPTPAISGTLDFCEGDSTTIDAGAGFSTYSWSNTGNSDSQSIVVNIPGPYIVTVSDGNGCIGMDTVDILQNTNPAPMITGVDSICAGGVTTLDAGGGFADYLWSETSNTQTIDASSAAIFSVTVTDGNGCEGTDSFEVFESAELEPQIAGSLSFCTGSSTTLDAGAGFTTYAWSNSTDLQTLVVDMPGEYMVTVTDVNGCTGVDTVMITENTELSPQITGALEFCERDSTTLDAGSGFDTYVWSNGSDAQTLNASLPGEYSVTVTDITGCTGTDTVTVVENALPIVNINGALEFCEEDSTLLIADAGFDSYEWSLGGDNDSLNVSTPGEVSVLVIDANGCVNTDTVEVLMNLNPKPVIMGDTVFCFGQSLALDAGSGFDTYSWSSLEDSQTISAGIAGSYSVTVTDANGCQGSDEVAITENPELIPDIQGVLSFCPGGSTTLDAGFGFNSYVWSTNAFVQNILVDNPGDYSVTVTDALGCEGIDTVSVIESGMLQIDIAGSLSFCSGDSVQLDAGAGFATYAWSNMEGSQNVNVTTGGEYSVTVTDFAGCIGVDTVDVVENALPNLMIGGSTSFCSGGSTTLNAGAGYSNYQWSDTSDMESLMVSAPGIYSVTVTDVNGCSANESVDVTESTELNPVITGILEFCEGQTTTLDAGLGFDTYEWSNMDIVQSITIDQPGEYIVNVTDVNGCSGADTVQVVEFLNPTVMIDGTLSFCIGTTTTLDAGAGFTTYLWSDDSDLPTLDVSLEGNYGVTVTDSNGCMGSDQVMVAELQEPPITQLSPVVCNGDTFEVGSSTYDMSGDYTDILIAQNGCDSVVMTNLTVLNPIVENFAASLCDGDSIFVGGAWQTVAGTYTDILMSAQGCDSTIVTNLVVAPCEIDVEIAFVNLDCFESMDGSITITPTTGNEPYTYNWIEQGSGDTGNGTITSLGDATIIDNLPAGNYSITVVDNVGGEAILSANVTQPSVLTSTIDITAPIECNGDQSGALAISVIGGTPGYNLNWSNGSSDINLLNLSADNYAVTITDLNGCTAENAQALTEPDPIEVSLSSQNVSCFGLTDGSITIDNVTGGNGPYEFSLDGLNYGADLIYSGLEAGNYSVFVQDAGNCVNEASNLIISSPPELSIAIDERIEVHLGDTISLEPLANFPVSQTIWSPANGLSCDTCTVVTAFPTNSQVYTITQFLNDDCFTSVDVELVVDRTRRFYAPNVFSPGNQDGINDVFFLQGGSEVAVVNTFVIFNRWGGVVFQMNNIQVNDPAVGWDGRFQGEILDADVFTWYAEVTFKDGKVDGYEGDVLIIN